MPSKITLLLIATVAHTFCLAVQADEEVGRPNVVVILTDDQGWGDLSVNGNSNLATPNIDSLARDGASLQNFYVCHVCAPTRAEFLTGRYYPKTGVSGVSRGEGRLNADETTIADVFHRVNYATGCFGKWHNGTQPPLHPNNRGFDEYYGFTSGHWGHYFSPPLDHNGKRVRGNGFVVDDFTDHAIDFIKTNSTKPFFCYLPLNTPHSPMMVDDRFYNKFKGADLKLKHRDPEREDIMMTRAALAMCENIDWNVGRVLKTLDNLHLRDNTIVVFFCDNGPNSYRWNGGMKGKKGSIDEGGLRSPCFVCWPGRISAGRKVDYIAGAIDLLPTLARLADVDAVTAKPKDGVSLAALLLGYKVELIARQLFSIKGKQVSVRTQQHRLDAAGQLFAINNDRGQRKNLAKQLPYVAAEMTKLADAHSKAMQPHFARNAGRPFHVGFGPSTTLPARDGIEHGTIQRSAKPPNNSFFKNWTSTDDSITWKINVAENGPYRITVHYTCAAGDEGTIMQLGVDAGHKIQSTVTEAFDPPLYDKSLERVQQSHYFVKDFKSLTMGNLELTQGEALLRLKAVKITGKQAIDVHSVDLVRLTEHKR